MKKAKRTPSALSKTTVEIFEQSRLMISGCIGVTHFSSEEIVILTKSAHVSIFGEGLTLCWAGDGRLMIKGTISCVRYGGEK